jgi:hypothetical protein
MNNNILYNAVFNGALSSTSMLQNGISLPSDYDGLINRCRILAGLIDSMIPAGPFTTSSAELLCGITESVLRNRPLFGATINFTAIADNVFREWQSAAGELLSFSTTSDIALGIRHGDTAHRPAAVQVGETYFDETTGQVLIWNGVAWVLAIPAGYDDVQGTIDQATAVAALTYEAYKDTPFMQYWFRRDQDDSLSMTYQMRHNWLLNSVEPHIHLTLAGPTDGNVVLTGRLAWSSFAGNLAIPSWAGWTPFTVTVPFLGADIWLPKAVSLGQYMPPAAARYPSAMLRVWIQRPGATDPNDTYAGNKPAPGTAAANLGVEFADCHIQLAGFGTKTLYS